MGDSGEHAEPVEETTPTGGSRAASLGEGCAPVGVGAGVAADRLAAAMGNRAFARLATRLHDEGALVAATPRGSRRAISRAMLQRAYGDDAIKQAEAGDVAGALQWLSPQSMEALVSILGRARSHKGVLEALLGALQSDSAYSLNIGVPRLEAAVRAAQLRGRPVTSADRMTLRLLEDAAGLPEDQRKLLESGLGDGKQTADGLDATLAQGDFKTGFALLNGMSMEAMLKRLMKLGMSWLPELAMNMAQADFLGPDSRARLEIAINATAGHIAGVVSAEAVQQLNERMENIKLPDDQRAAVRAILPRAEPAQYTIVREFRNVSISALFLPLAVDHSFKLLNGHTNKEIATIVGALDESILVALVSNTRIGEGKYDIETIRQGLNIAWRERHGDAPAPWRLGESKSVASMTAADKVLEAMNRSLPELGPEAAERVHELMTPESLAMIATFTGLYIASQWTPAGWATDLLVLGLAVAGLALAGPEVIEIVKHLVAFLEVTTASSDPEIDAAAHHFAVAVTKLTIDVIAAILLHRVAKASGPKGIIGKTVKAAVTPEVKVSMVTADGVVLDVDPTKLESRGSGRGSGGGGRVGGRGVAGGVIEYESPPRADGTVVIRSRVGRPPGRLGLEEILPPGVEVNLEGWERAHSQGNITGAESARGIRYAPREVNQRYQRLGIEQAIRDLFSQKAADAEVVMTTETSSHPGTLRLAKIVYRIDMRKPGTGATIRVYEASIEVANETTQPRITVPEPEPIGWSLLEDGGWLKPVAAR
jgi:hypothetical protein